MVKSTPWGKSQDSIYLGNGMTFHSTARHGGIHLDPATRKAMSRLLPDEYQNFLNSMTWWEEDCDMVVPMYVFYNDRIPNEFGERNTREALKENLERTHTYAKGGVQMWEAIKDCDPIQLEKTL